MTPDDTNADPAALPHRIGAPARRALAAAGYSELNQLSAVREADLLALHGVGPKAIRILREELATRGLDFARDPAD